MANRWEVMSKYSREQHPLLCEEGSEEELYSPRFYRRDPTSYRARARTKGLAAILTRWPDHWSSFVTYWWIGIGMISFTTFIVYNSLFAFSMLPAVNMKPASIITTDENRSTIISATLPEVYMHVFTDQNEEIDLSQYLPYLETIASTFMDYKFNFIVVINVTDVSWLSAEENNEMALNMLWTTNNHIYQKTIRSPNVNIEHVSLSLYLDNSPLNKYWRILPQHLIEFLVRTVSIWDKGGVALNPDILSPKFQHSLYVKKLQKLLNKYANTNKVMNDSNLLNKITKAPKKYKKVNNIRDIINALEKDNVSGNAFSQQILTEAENRDISFVRRERQAPAKTNINTVNSAITYNTEPLDKIISNTNKNATDSFNQSTHVINENSTKPHHLLEISSNSSNISFLPLFLKFLFKNRAHIKPEPTEKSLINRTRKSVIEMSNSEEYTQNNFLEETKKEFENGYKPVIVSAAAFVNKSENYNRTDGSHDEFTEQDLEANTLTIDLKGNIIATNVPCHAFLGTMYSNVIHHNQEESLSDFIVAELSIFCKGLLSSCNGIDLILI